MSETALDQPRPQAASASGAPIYYQAGQGRQLQLSDYVRIAQRRLAYVLVPFVIVAVAVVSLVVLIPPIYRSVGVIAVDSQQIPEDLVPTTIR